MTKRFLSRKEASDYCTSKGTPAAVATLAKYVTVGGGPEYQSFGRFPRYTAESLDAWIASRLTPPRSNSSRGA